MKNHVRKLVAFLMALLMAFEMAPVAVLAEALTDVPAAQEQAQEEISEELPEEPLAVDNSDAQQLFNRQLTKPTEEPKPEILHSVELGQDQLVMQPVAPETLDSLIQQIEGLTIQSGSIRKMGIKKQAAAGPMKADAPTVGDDSASHTGYAAFDIAPAEGQPQAEQYTVTVDLANPVDLLADYALEKDRSYTIDAVSYTLYHFHTGEDGETRMETIALTDDNVVREKNLLKRFTFTTGDFSTFVIKYTVDFHYNGVDYSIPGESQILLSDLIQQLNIMNGDALLDVADVAKVEFTDEHLVEVQQVSGPITIIAADGEKHEVDAGAKDFLLSSKEAFTSEEKLTITLIDGRVIVVGVTDAQEYEYTLDGVSDTITIKELYDYFGSPLNYDENLIFCIDYGIGDPANVTFEYQSALWDHSGIQSTYDASSKTITISGLSTIPAGECVIVNLMRVDAIDQPSFKLTQPVKEEECIFTYTLDEVNLTATITGFVDDYDTVGDIEIPEALTVDGTTYNVTKIAAGAFNGNNLLQKVTFKGMINILTDGVAYAFAGSSITEAVFEKAAEIGDYAFKDCANLASVTFGGSTATLHTGAFKDCASLASVTYDSNSCWMSLGGDAFNGCSSLTGDFPGLRYVAYGAFYGTNIDSAEVIDWNSYSNRSFDGVQKPIDFTLTGDDLTISFDKGKSTKTTKFKTFTINAKDSLSFSGSWALQGPGTGLETLTINCDNKIELTEEVLSYHAATTNIVINAPVSTIVGNAFLSGHASVAFNDAVETVDSYAFNNYNLGSNGKIQFNDSVGTVNFGAFNGASLGASSSVSFGGVALLGKETFSNASFASGAKVTFGSVAEIENYGTGIFEGCTFAGSNVINFNGLGSVPSNMMNNCTFNGATQVNITASGDTISVDENCFPDNANLTVFFKLYRDNVTGAEAMENAHPNTTFRYLGDAIDLRDADKYQVLLSSMIETKEPAILNPDSGEKLDVADVASVAFTASETGSTKVLKAGTTYKYNGEDEGKEFTANDFLLQNDTDTFNTKDEDEIVITLKNGKKVYVNKKLRYTAHQNPFSLDDMLGELELPTDSLMALTLVDSSNHILMEANEAGTDQELTLFSQLPEAGLTVQLKNGEDEFAKIVILQGEEITFPMMDDSGIFTLEWYDDNEGGNAVNITGLTDHYGKLSGQEGNVQIPGKVKFHGDDKVVYVIPTGAFKNEDRLKTVTFTNKADYIQINEGAFDNCAKLTSISGTAPVDLMTKAIENCPALTNVDLTLKNVRNDQFPIITGNVALTDVRLVYPKVEYYSLTGEVVSGNNALKNLTVDNGNKPFTGIAQEGFKGMTSLETVTILPYVEQDDYNDNIGASAFEGCTNLHTVTLGEGNNNKDNTLSIGADAFKGTNISPDCVVGVWQYSDNGGLPPHVTLGATLVITKDDEENDAVTAEDEDEEAIRAKAKEFYKPNTFDIVFFDVSLVAPNGEPIAFATEDEKKALDVIMDAQLPWRAVGGVTDPRTAAFYKHGEQIEAVQIGDVDRDYTDGQINRVRFDLMSLSPLGIAARTAYHDDLYWYTLSEKTEYVSEPDENGSHYRVVGVNAKIVGLYDETLKDLVIPGETHDDNKYTVSGIADNTFKNLNTINSVTFENTEDITVGSDAFAGSSLTKVEFKNQGKVTLYYRAFEDNKNLTDLQFNGSNTDGDYVSLYEHSFDGCENLTKVSGTGTVSFYTYSGGSDFFTGCPLKEIDLTVSSLPDWNKFKGNGYDNLKTLKLKNGGYSALTFANTDNIGFPELTTVDIDMNGRAVTFEANAFGSAPKLESVIANNSQESSWSAPTLTVKTGAFSASAPKLFETNGKAVIQAGAFSATPATVILSRPKPERSSSMDYHQIYEGAFTGRIKNLRIDWPIGLWDGAFAGGDFFITNCTTLWNVAPAIGKFTNHIYLSQLTSTLGREDCFSGATDKQPEKVYFAQPFENRDLNGEPIMVRGNKSIASAPATTTFYFDCEKDANTLAEDLDTKIKAAQPNAPKVRYKTNDDGEGAYYMSGMATNENATGAKNAPFKTWAQLIEATKGKNPDGRTVNETIKGCADAVNAVKLSMSDDPSFTVNYKGMVLVLDAIKVTGTETWNSDPSDPIILYRDPSNLGAMVEVPGTLTLEHVILDGNKDNTNGVRSAMVVVTSSNSLHINSGAELRNNDHSVYTYPKGGGAVLADGGKVVVDGGKIYGNRASNWGGGIHALNGTVELKNGEIRDNEAFANGGNKASGGGVALNNGSSMTMSGGTVSGNKSTGSAGSTTPYSVGGGIAAGVPIAVTGQNFHKGHLTMFGGTISGNTSAGEGGGIYIEGDSTAKITSGTISGNTSNNGSFGGGGIYVNGGRYVQMRDGSGNSITITTADGHLYLDNVVITGNSAGKDGGGLAGCPTSASEINLVNGAAFYNNGKDDIYVESSAILGSNMTAYISAKRFDKQDHKWVDMNGKAVLEGRIAKTTSTTQIKASNTSAATGGSVFITGNTAKTNGGGIGSNGSVTVGTNPSPSDVFFTPDVWKLVKGRDMEEDEAFTFSVYEGKFAYGGIPANRIDYLGVEVAKDKNGKAVTGKVTLAKDGTNKAIEFSNPIYLGKLGENNMGDERVFLVVEDKIDNQTTLLDNHYLAFKVIIGADFDEHGNAVYTAGLAQVGTAVLTYDEDGNPVFNKYNAYPYFSERIEPEDAIFTNILNDREISATKEWLNIDEKDKEAPIDAKVTFELLADGKSLTPAKTVTLDGKVDEDLTATSTQGEWTAWKATWKGLDIYREGHEGEADQKIVYTVKETEVKPADYYEVVKAEVEVTKDDPKVTDPIQNKRKVGDLKVSKTVKSQITVNVDQEFSFTVKLDKDPATGKTVSGKFEAVKSDGEGKTTKTTITLNEEGVSEAFTLKHKESLTIKGLPVGIGYTVDETPVEYYEAEKASIKGTIATEPTEAGFINTYKATGEVQFQGEKVLEKRTFNGNDELYVKVSAAEGVKLPDPAEKKLTLTNGQNTVAFDFNTITYDLSDMGGKDEQTFVYTVTETANMAGTASDTKTHTVTVKLTDNKKGELVPTVTYSDGNKGVKFVNTYDASGKITLGGTKFIENREFQAGDSATMKIEAITIGAPMPKESTVTVTPTSGQSVPYSFEPIEYKLEDIPEGADHDTLYQYKVTESAFDMKGVTKDTTEHTVTVKVKDNSTGALTVTSDVDKDALDFTNPYSAAGHTTLDGVKTIENRDFQAGDKWVFTVTSDKSEVPMPKTTSVTIEPAEGKTAAIDFGEIEYTEADADKTYVYTITETGTVKGVSNDSVKTATVKITDNGDGTLKVEKTYNDGTEDLTFTNTYNADGETTLKGAKKIAGREFKAGDKWTFKVTAQPADAPMPEKTEITVEPTEGSSVDLDFGKIAYQLADLKGETSASFTYTITETGAVKGVTNDSAKTVTIQVTDNKDGTLKVENSANETSLVFTNTYDAKGEVTLSARKVLEGRELKEGEFSFQLKDKNGTVLQTKANALDGSVTFDKIAYTLADVKNSPFTYTINEVEPADKSVIFDRTVKTVTVTLTDKGDGTVQAVADKTAEELTFTNQVTLVKVKKTDLDTGKALAGATIQILDKDGNVLDEWVTTLENHESRGLKIGEEYTIRETAAPAGYAVTTEFTFTIDETGKVHSIAEQTEDGALKVEDPPETTEATVKKVWVDADDADGIRPEKLTVKLSNGEQYELNAENEWTVTVKDLPKYEEAEDGTLQEIAYTWQEVDLPEGYTLTNTETQGTVTTLTNSHDAGKISLSVMKIWQDDGNRDGIRPVSLTVDLYADGAPSGKSVILRAENNWFATLSDLDKIKDGAEITYQWVENLPSTYKYTLTNEATVGSITMLTNTYQPEKTAVKVRKDWDDHENAAKLRPESIQVQLYANGVACGAAVALSAANGWHYEWTNLNKYDNPKGLTGTQQAISYTVEEIGTPAHYSSALAGSQTAGYTITNKLAAGNLIIEKTFEIVPVATVVTPTPTPTATPEPTPEPEVTPEPTPEAERIDIPVTKVWKDNDDRDGNRPAAVTVHLLADGTEVASAVLSSTNSWSHTFVSLPTRNGEDVIQYTVTEDPVEWYQTQVSGFTITNVYRPEVTSVTVQKVWDDDNNALGMRPAAIVVVLSNGQAVTLNEYNGWRATVNNLPTRVNGQPVTYTWHEQEVLGYVQTGYYVTGDTTVFTNSIHRRLVEPPENAPKKKRGETYYVLDDYETPLGVEVTINHVGDCFD